MQDTSLIGRVLRASTTGFDCGSPSNEIGDKHALGAFVKVPVNDDGTGHAIGLIYAIRIDDDPLVRELAMANVVDNNTLYDQRKNRMVPVEIGVINIGYSYNGGFYHSLPPRPPLSLSQVSLCDAEEIYHFTSRCDFFRLVLNAAEVPSDELLAATLNYASYAYPDHQRREFLIRSGRHLAVLLSNDLKRLQHILALIHPG